MRILFIVTEYNSANGICTQSVMNEFTKEGHSVYCITNDEPHGELIKQVKYSFVKPRLSYKLLSCKNPVKRLAGKIINKIKLILTYPTWPLISPSYTDRIYKEAKKLCEKEKIDIIVPVYTQIDTIIAAYRIKRKNPNIKYVPYFLDSFSGGYGPKCFSKKWLIKRGMKWEDKLLPSADKIIMMQSCKEHYCSLSKNKEYFEKILFLDLPLISKPVLTESGGRDGLVHFVYVGTIPVHVRNPEIFLKVFCKTANQNYRLHIIGTNTCPDMMESYAKSDSRIILENAVSHEEAVKRIADADVLVNFGNNISAMTPSKIFEYMSYGKPIVSTLPIPDEPSAVYLKRYPLSFLVEYADINVISVAGELENWVEKSIGKVEDFEQIEKMFEKNTPGCFVRSVI